MFHYMSSCIIKTRVKTRQELAYWRTNKIGRLQGIVKYSKTILNRRKAYLSNKDHYDTAFVNHHVLINIWYLSLEFNKYKIISVVENWQIHISRHFGRRAMTWQGASTILVNTYMDKFILIYVFWKIIFHIYIYNK